MTITKELTGRAIRISKPEIALMSRQTIIASLKSLKDDLEMGAEDMELESIFDLELSAGHMLVDLCDCLGLSREEIQTIIGEETNA